MMERKWMAALVMGITMLAGAAQAKDPVLRQCIQDARTESKACSQTCRDNFLADIDTCRNVNHDCAQQARDDRKQCVDDVIASLHDCFGQMCADAHAMIEACRADHPAGSKERDACIDNAQLLGFQCRDTCRENVHLFSSLKQCRIEFKQDLMACTPPAPMPTPMGP
jgi:hypothetical protein